MPGLIATISGHRAYTTGLREAVGTTRPDGTLPATADAEGLPAELLGIDPPGMAAAAEVPAERIAAQEQAMQQDPVLETAPLLRRTVTDSEED